MRPFFFGEAERPLFGVYEPPWAAARNTGVVLCYPGAQEYNATHWAFRKLTSLLSSAGYHVLRFDWSCTGDSAGESADGRPETWIQDLRLAVEELREQAGIRAVSLIGMRLGATLAYRCAMEFAVRELVLWEPVVSGVDYVRDLRALDDRRRLRLLHPPGPEDELLGFPFPAAQRQAIEALDLRQLALPKARRVLLFAALESRSLHELHAKLKPMSVPSELHLFPGEEGLQSASEREAALLSGKVLAAMTDALGGREKA